MDKGSSTVIARRFVVRGRVQGVGFRPFVLRLALQSGVRGWVRNCGGEVHIHAEASAERLARFATALMAEAPPLAVPEAGEAVDTTVEHIEGFSIRDSGDGAVAHATLPPDHVVCADCLAEMGDPAARRFRYPFTNCTQCGPRYTIIDRLP